MYSNSIFILSFKIQSLNTKVVILYICAKYLVFKIQLWMKDIENFEIRSSTMKDVVAVRALYQKITTVPDGIIRRMEEITESYVAGFLKKSLENGIGLLAYKKDGEIIGEIHAHTPPIFAFQHLLTDLTIMVDPDVHGQGIGRALFDAFLLKVQTDFQHIYRVELFVREHNERNVQFYESLGFINEGRQKGKIFIGKGILQTPLHMVWFNPFFSLLDARYET